MMSEHHVVWTQRDFVRGTIGATICLRIIMEKRREFRGEPWPLSPPPLSIVAADEKFGLGTARLAQIKVDASGWADGRLV